MKKISRKTSLLGLIKNSNVKIINNNYDIIYFFRLFQLNKLRVSAK